MANGLLLRSAFGLFLLSLSGACGDGAALPPGHGGHGGRGAGGGAGAPTICDEGAGGAETPPGGGGDPTALAELAHATMPLVDWKFAPDPGDQGVAQGWSAPTFDDAGWATLKAGATWEDQGFPGLDGVAWYRRHVVIPADWHPGPIRFVSNGVDDAYDLYVNGQHAGHMGQEPDGSVYNRVTKIDIDPWVVRGQDNVIAVRVVDWGLGGGLWRSAFLRATVPLDAYQSLLPSPVLDADPAWVDLYFLAWRLAWDKVSFGNDQNQLAPAYMGVGFDEHVYQWDSSFIALFGRYGARLFPVMPTLDNFYARQRPDGYIQRVYSETTGAEVGDPTSDEPLVNPPLFAWVEWEYYRTTGDASRLATVLPKLAAYYAWLEANVSSPTAPGLYRQTDLGSGMDNTPRGDVWQGAWVDMSSQQALAALHLARIAGALGDAGREAEWQAKYDALAAIIDDELWSEADGFYYDRTSGGALAGVKHIGGFWPLLAEIGDDSRAARLAEHLDDPAEFRRDHMFPSLAASDPSFTARGHYWRGGVWAPTNYMTITGLARWGHGDLAREAAHNHIARMSAVYASPPADESMIAPDERDGQYATIWECYSPDLPAPATRWDDTYYSRQDFVGWSGVGPIALLIEQVIGVQTVGAERAIAWTVTRTDRHGVLRLPLGLDNEVSLVADARAGADAPIDVHVTARRRFTLQIGRPGTEPSRFDVCAGESSIRVP